MHRDHEQFEKVMDSMAELGVKISVTKSRLEIFKVLEEIQSTSGFTEYHAD